MPLSNNEETLPQNEYNRGSRRRSRQLIRIEENDSSPRPRYSQRGTAKLGSSYLEDPNQQKSETYENPVAVQSRSDYPYQSGALRPDAHAAYSPLYDESKEIDSRYPQKYPRHSFERYKEHDAARFRADYLRDPTSRREAYTGSRSYEESEATDPLYHQYYYRQDSGRDDERNAAQSRRDHTNESTFLRSEGQRKRHSRDSDHIHARPRKSHPDDHKGTRKEYKTQDAYSRKTHGLEAWKERCTNYADLTASEHQPHRSSSQSDSWDSKDKRAPSPQDEYEDSVLPQDHEHKFLRVPSEIEFHTLKNFDSTHAARNCDGHIKVLMPAAFSQTKANFVSFWDPCIGKMSNGIVSQQPFDLKEEPRGEIFLRHIGFQNGLEDMETSFESYDQHDELVKKLMSQEPVNLMVGCTENGKDLHLRFARNR